MPNVNKASAFILSILTLLVAQPTLAQNSGVRGGMTRGGGVSGQTRAVSSPSRSYSAPTTRSAPTRGYSAPSRSSSPSRGYSAPSRSSNRSYNAPLTRQSVSLPTARTSNSSYRTNTIPSTYRTTNTIPSTYTVNQATYPGRINPTTARVNS